MIDFTNQNTQLALLAIGGAIFSVVMKWADIKAVLASWGKSTPDVKPVDPKNPAEKPSEIDARFAASRQLQDYGKQFDWCAEECHALSIKLVDGPKPQPPPTGET